MNRLLISPRHLQTVGRHAAMTAPEECCGVLIGRSIQGTTMVERVLLVGNASPGDRQNQYRRHRRYQIPPETVLAAHKEARALGLEVVGYYHSHPDSPARPSEADRENAWPGMSSLIVSLNGRQIAEVRSWRLGDTGFEEEEIDQAALRIAV
jgi:proteasome lid subunit RPN8/RPN11